MDGARVREEKLNSMRKSDRLKKINIPYYG